MGLGEGAAASVDAVGGAGPHGPVVGGGITAGTGLGDMGSVGGTVTRITPLAGRYVNACLK